MTEKTRLIVRVVMTEYMILMGGALLLYLAELVWPHDLVSIGWIGGSLLAMACAVNVSYLLRTDANGTDARVNYPSDERPSAEQTGGVSPSVARKL
jgi:hypothetical protein